MHATETEALDWAKHIFAELPVAGLLSARPIRCDPQRGRITVAFPARPEFCNLVGSVQGGMLTAMLDLAMSFAVLCALDDGHVVPSLEIKTSFIAPARPGEIVGEGMLVRKGHSIAFMELHGRQAHRPAGQPSHHCERYRPDPPARAGRGGVKRRPRQALRPPCGPAGGPVVKVARKTGDQRP